MKQNVSGSILLINLFFVALFSVYIGIVFRQIMYLSEQLTMQYHYEQEKYCVETALWWAVALCIDQFETMQNLCKRDTVCHIPAERMRQLYKQADQKVHMLEISIRTGKENELFCRAQTEAVAASCVCYRTDDGTSYGVQAWKAESAH